MLYDDSVSGFLVSYMKKLAFCVQLKVLINSACLNLAESEFLTVDALTWGVFANTVKRLLKYKLKVVE